MNSENFVCIVICYGFYYYLKRMFFILWDEIELYVVLVYREGGSFFGILS